METLHAERILGVYHALLYHTLVPPIVPSYTCWTITVQPPEQISQLWSVRGGKNEGRLQPSNLQLDKHSLFNH